MQTELINAIKDKKNKQADIAALYALAIKADLSGSFWPEVNALIVGRWSKSGLNRIKTAAWKMVHYAD